MANPYSIGRDCRITLLWNGSRIDLRDVTGFQSEQHTIIQRATPLNGLPVEFNTPSGWRGIFTIARANANLDSLVAAIEASFWNAGNIGSGTLYQYIREPDGTTTTWEYSGVSLSLKTDRWQAEGMIHQHVQFYASLRSKIS